MGRSETAGRLRVRPWQLIAGLAVVAVGLVAVVMSMLNSTGPAPDRSDGPVAARPRPTDTRTVPTASVTGPVVITPQPSKSQPSRVPMPSPPVPVPAPSIAVTPVPNVARTIRFEARAEGGALIEVSLSDATHQRHDFLPQRETLAFEIPVPRA